MPRSTLDCGECRLCIDACPTDALAEAGTLDATRCLSYWTQAAAPIPEDYREQLGDMVYGCDICQDVCPWNRGIEKRRADAEPGEAVVSLADWLSADDLADRYDRLYVPETIRATCAGTRSSRSGTPGAIPSSRGRLQRVTTRFCASTPSGRSRGSRGRLVNYDQRVQGERWLAWVRLGAVPFAAFQAAANSRVPARRRALDAG